MFAGVNIAGPLFATANSVLMVNGTGAHYVGMDFAATEQPQEESNQDFYRKLCDYYSNLNEDKWLELMCENYDPGAIIDYKQLYEKLRENF